MATPQQRRQFDKQKRELTQKTQQLNRDLEKLRQGQVALERDRRALESDKREWKNKKAKLQLSAAAARSQPSPATSPRRGGGNAVSDRKLQKLQQELERLKRELGDKNAQLRSLRTQNKALARDLRVLKKQLAGRTGKVQIVDHTHITKAQINRLKRDLKIARKKIHKLLDSIRVRKRYYGKHVNKFKRGENKYVRERAAHFKREKVVIKYLFADRVNKVKLSRGKRDRVTLVTDDGEVVLRPVQLTVVPEGGAGDVDDPDEILRELGDIDLDDEDMELPPEDEDDDEDDEDEDAQVDDAELEAEIEAMLNDPEFANEDGDDDDDFDPVYGSDNFSFPADANAAGGSGDDDDGKDLEDDDDGKATEATEATEASEAGTDSASDAQGPYQVGDNVVIAGRAGSRDRMGIIRFIGPTPKSNGRDMFGIELIDGTAGKHNGTVNGVPYFTCPEKRGIFVKEDLIRRRMRPKDQEKVEQQTAAIAQNEQRRLSSDHHSGGRGGLKGNLMTFVIQESSRRGKDIDQLKDLLELEDPREQNSGFGELMSEYQQRHEDFIANLDSLSGQPDTEEFDDVRTYNSSFMNFVALLGNTMAGKALLAESSKQSLEYFLEELTNRIQDVHRLQDIHFDRDDNPDEMSKEERCQQLFQQIVERHQREEDELKESAADNAPTILEDFRTNNENWRGAMLHTKLNHDQLEKLLKKFAERTRAIAGDIDIWKRLWEPPAPAEEQQVDNGDDEDQPEPQPENVDDPDAPPEDSGDEM